MYWSNSSDCDVSSKTNNTSFNSMMYIGIFVSIGSMVSQSLDQKLQNQCTRGLSMNFTQMYYWSVFISVLLYNEIRLFYQYFAEGYKIPFILSILFWVRDEVGICNMNKTCSRVQVHPHTAVYVLILAYCVRLTPKKYKIFQSMHFFFQNLLQHIICSLLFQLTNAIKNSLEHNPSGQPYDGPMGVTISITPAHILDSLNKQAITNASFKAQKLPGMISSGFQDTEIKTIVVQVLSDIYGQLHPKLQYLCFFCEPLTVRVVCAVYT